MDRTRDATLTAQRGIRDMQMWSWGPFAVSTVKTSHTNGTQFTLSLPFGYAIVVGFMRFIEA